jgi:hypothetical protein
MTQHGLTAGYEAVLDHGQPKKGDYIEKTPARAAFSCAFVLALFVDGQIGWKQNAGQSSS